MFGHDIYVVSLCKNGVLGGLLYLTETEMIYCTNKLSVPKKIRRLHMPYHQISDIKKAPLHRVIVSMKHGEDHKFLVFSRKNFLKKIRTRMHAT